VGSVALRTKNQLQDPLSFSSHILGTMSTRSLLVSLSISQEKTEKSQRTLWEEMVAGKVLKGVKPLHLPLLFSPQV
jgi:hypothetical protein